MESDECFTSTEPSALIPLSKTGFAPKIISVTYYGDENQLGPVVLGAQRQHGSANLGYNEFGQQLRHTLPKRMVRSGFPVYYLKTQSRCHPAVFAPANKCFYDDKVANPHSDDPRFALLPKYQESLRRVLGVRSSAKLTNNQARLVLFKVENKQPTQRARTSSRSNFSTFDYITQTLVPALQETLGQNVNSDVSIITLYARQAELYNS